MVAERQGNPYIPDMPVVARLPWQKDADLQSFVAYPNGAERQDERATVQWRGAGGYQAEVWQWTVSIRDLARDGGTAPTKQAAADAATAAWHRVASAASVKLGTAERIDAIKAAYRLGATGPLVDVEGETAAFLRKLIFECRAEFEAAFRSRQTSPFEPLMDLCSRELFRRRLAGIEE